MNKSPGGFLAMRSIGVYPGRELESRRRLVDALAEAFAIRFEPVETLSAGAAQPLICFGDFARTLPSDAGSFYVAQGESGAREGTIAFANSPLVDSRIRGRALRERHLGARAVAPAPGDRVLATADEKPVWLVRGEPGRSGHIVSAAPSELGPGEVLRDRLDPERFMELLPLVHWLRELTEPFAWRPPEPRAAFIVDDPNLHWHAYGHLDFRELVRHARAHRYHASIATVPLDAWYAHGPTVRMFDASRDVLSLSVHGNNHVRRELGRDADLDRARRSLAQARRRIARFERRTGLQVSQVMVPPYETTSVASLRAMLEVGFDAATVTRPCTWLPLDTGASPYRTEEGDVLSGWHIAELTTHGFPLLIRRLFHEHDAIVLRSFLGQPMLLYGHASDFAEGLGCLEEAARIVNEVPSVAWCSLADIAAGSYETRSRGGTLAVRPFSRHIRLHVDPSLETLEFVPPPGAQGFELGATITVNGSVASLGRESGVELAPADRPRIVEIDWEAPRMFAPEDVPRPPVTISPLARRAAAEVRDRLAAVTRRRNREATAGAASA